MSSPQVIQLSLPQSLAGLRPRAAAIIGVQRRSPSFTLIEVAELRALGANRKIGFAPRQIGKADRGVDLDPNARVLRAKPHERGSDERLGEPGRHAQPHGSLGSALESGCVLQEAGVCSRHLLGCGQ